MIASDMVRPTASLLWTFLSFLSIQATAQSTNTYVSTKWRDAAEKWEYLPEERVLEAAQKGNADAQFWYARNHEIGALQKNLALSIEWYEKAASRGQPHAQWALAWKYRRGEGVKKNPEKEKELFLAAGRTWLVEAEKGDAMTQQVVGMMYRDGLGFAHDDKEAAKWYLRAAGQGEAGAEISLAEMYEKGEGVAKDYKEAARWYQDLAESDDHNAQYRLGLLYLNGVGLAKDRVEAYKWFWLAAKEELEGWQYEPAVKSCRDLGPQLTKEEMADANRRVEQFRKTGFKNRPRSRGWD